MDHTTLWLAQERITEARRKAAEQRQTRVVRGPGRRPLLQRIRGER